MFRRCCSGPPQVLVWEVKNRLIIRVAVNCGHRALLDAERIVQNFDDWGETIRRAGRIRDHRVLRGVVFSVIHAQDDGDIFAFGGAEMMTFLTEPRKCFLGIRRIREPASRFDNNLGAYTGPVDFRRIFDREYSESLYRQRGAYRLPRECRPSTGQGWSRTLKGGRVLPYQSGHWRLRTRCRDC